MNQFKPNPSVFFLILLFTMFAGIANAQVSIGTANPPAKAALLEIKNKEATNPSSVTDASNVTSDKGGLGLPRVRLVSKTTLEPFVSKMDADWVDAATSKIKEKHAGLTVYNIYESPVSQSDPNLTFYKGIYVWDGAQWYSITNADRFFYMPAFNLPVRSVTQASEDKPTYDLYKEYKNQFTKAGNAKFKTNNPGLTNVPSPRKERLYEPRELDYVVTYYDDDIIKINKISVDGLMEYEVKDTDPSPTSFVNILFIIK